MASPVVLVLITLFSITAIAAAAAASASRCINNNNFNSSMIIQQQEEEEEEGCVLVADEDHSEFLMDSQISSSSSRMLLDPGGSVIGRTFDPRNAVYMCEKYIPYTSCLPKSNFGKPITEPCSGQYNNRNRGCPG